MADRTGGESWNQSALLRRMFSLRSDAPSPPRSFFLPNYDGEIAPSPPPRVMAGNAIISDALDCRIRDGYVYFKNYEEWRLKMKTYLLARGLWDVVKPTAKGQKRLTKTWKKKDATVLHAIHISCGANAFSLIKDITRASTAWATLERKKQETEKNNQESDVDLKSLGEEFGKEIEEESRKARTCSDDDDDENILGGSDTKKIDEFRENRLFFKAVMSGDLNKLNKFIEQNEGLLSARIPSSGKNALHVAINAGHVHIARRLISLMSKDELEVKRNDGLTVLHAAVETGNIEIARCLVKKNSQLTVSCAEIEDIERHSHISSMATTHNVYSEFTYTPLLQAVIYGQAEMAHYLYSITSKEFLEEELDGTQGSALITQCIFRKYFDIALDLLRSCPRLAFIKDDFERNPLYELASTPHLFRGGRQLGFWQKLTYDCISIPSTSGKNDHVSVDILNHDSNTKNFSITISDFQRIYEMKLSHVRCLELLKCMAREVEEMNEKEIQDARVRDAVAKAAYNGSVEFITEIARASPEFVWTRDLATKVFAIAIDRREAEVFNLIYALHDRDALVSFVESRTTILHIAGSQASTEVRNLIPGAAFQMQRELQWFKEVEALGSHVIEYEDEKKRKARDVFTEHHSNLVSAGEKWMKDTSTSCTVVGALIVTIMFTVAFTVPGGNDQNTGFPLFSNKILFKIFMISDAISLFSSTTSVLMFLGILTSRYAEDDFLKSLPNKLIIGLSCLFLSIATMMITFSAALSIMFHGQVWIVVPVIFLACAPVILFMWMQFPPLCQMIMSTYGPSIFDRKAKNWLYVTSN